MFGDEKCYTILRNRVATIFFMEIEHLVFCYQQKIELIGSLKIPLDRQIIFFLANLLNTEYGQHHWIDFRVESSWLTVLL